MRCEENSRTIHYMQSAHPPTPAKVRNTKTMSCFEFTIVHQPKRSGADRREGGTHRRDSSSDTPCGRTSRTGSVFSSTSANQIEIDEIGGMKCGEWRTDVRSSRRPEKRRKTRVRETLPGMHKWAKEKRKEKSLRADFYC